MLPMSHVVQKKVRVLCETLEYSSDADVTGKDSGGGVVGWVVAPNPGFPKSYGQPESKKGGRDRWMRRLIGGRPTPAFVSMFLLDYRQPERERV